MTVAVPSTVMSRRSKLALSGTRLVGYFALLGCLFALSGCANAPIKSSGSPSRALNLDAIRLTYDPTMPEKIELYRFGEKYGPKPVISDTDKSRAVLQLTAMNLALIKRFRSSFPVEARNYGLKIDNTRKDVPQLRVSIIQTRWVCFSSGTICGPTVRLAGKLLDTSDKTLWSFEFFVSSADSKLAAKSLEYNYLDTFEKGLLELMVTDRVISKPPVTPAPPVVPEGSQASLVST